MPSTRQTRSKTRDVGQAQAYAQAAEAEAAKDEAALAAEAVLAVQRVLDADIYLALSTEAAAQECSVLRKVDADGRCLFLCMLHSHRASGGKMKFTDVQDLKSKVRPRFFFTFFFC
jgi:hypothetical protein